MLSEKFDVKVAAMIRYYYIIIINYVALEGKVQDKALVMYYLFISNNNAIKEVPLILVFYI